MDLGPTALDLFGVDVPFNMDGKPLTISVGNNGNGKARVATTAAG